MIGSIKNVLAAVLVTGALVAGGVVAVTGQASAGDVDGVSYASTTKLTESSASGHVEEIHVGAAGKVTWENLPADAKRVKVELATNAGPDKQYQTFAERNYWQIPHQSDGAYRFDTVEGAVLNNTDFEPSTFSAKEDGSTQDRMFPVRVTIKVVDENGNVHKHVQYHKVTTSVENVGDPSVDAHDKTITGRIDMADSPNASNGDHADTDEDDTCECSPNGDYVVNQTATA